jgi:chromosome segregation ATPase
MYIYMNISREVSKNLLVVTDELHNEQHKVNEKINENEKMEISIRNQLDVLHSQINEHKNEILYLNQLKNESDGKYNESLKTHLNEIVSTVNEIHFLKNILEETEVCIYIHIRIFILYIYINRLYIYIYLYIHKYTYTHIYIYI